MVSGDKFYQLFSCLVIFLLGLGIVSITSIFTRISQWDYSRLSVQVVMVRGSTHTLVWSLRVPGGSYAVEVPRLVGLRLRPSHSHGWYQCTFLPV